MGLIVVTHQPNFNIFLQETFACDHILAFITLQTFSFDKSKTLQNLYCQKNDYDVIYPHSGEANASSNHYLKWIFCYRCSNVVFAHVAPVPNDVTQIFLIHQRHEKIFTAKKRFWCAPSPQWRGKCFFKPLLKWIFCHRSSNVVFPTLVLFM